MDITKLVVPRGLMDFKRRIQVWGKASKHTLALDAGCEKAGAAGAPYLANFHGAKCQVPDLDQRYFA